jgi:PKD repeat protein
MMSVTPRRLPHRWVAALVGVGVGLVFLISGSSAHADTIVSAGLNPNAVAVDGSGDVFISDTNRNRVVVDKPKGASGYTQSVVVDTGLSNPYGVAVDGSGDVFIADTDNSRVLLEKPNGSGGYTQSVVADAGLGDPVGVAVDGSGDVFVTDVQGNRVLVEKPNGSGGYTQSVIDDTGLSVPLAVAVDASGDVFIADTVNYRVLVDKPNGSGGYTQSVFATGLGSPSTVAVDGSGDVFIGVGNRVLVDKPNGTGGYTQSAVDDTLDEPGGVAVDGSGDVFIADTENNRVVVDKPNASGGYTQSGVDTPLASPQGVAVSGSGDVFIADAGNNRVLLDQPNGSGGHTQSVVDTALSEPTAVAVDGSGDVFIADTGNNRVVVDKPNGSGGYTQSVVADSTDLWKPSGVAVDASGDVFIADSNHGRVVVEKPNGSGGYTQSVVSTGGVAEVAVDASGDVFVVDHGGDQVLAEKPNGSGGYTQSVVDTGLSQPSAVAVDASGNVFIADTGNNRVVVDKPNGSGGYTQRLVDGGLSSPEGVAVDGSGDVFIADTGKNRVVEHSAVAPTALFTSAQTPGSLTVAFTDASTVAGPATITGWSWNFGDDSSASIPQQSPSHTYASAGTYTVRLTVTDSTGETSTISQQIVVAAHASLIYPAAGQTNVSTINAFRWADVPAGQGYQLWIGTKRGDGSLLKSGLLSATTSSYQVPALPAHVTLWARLFTGAPGNWGSYQDITFTVTANRVAFSYPTAGQQNVNTLTPFSWSPVANAQHYQLVIGTKPGLTDLVNSGILAANITNYRVPALPTGKTLYAKIVSQVAGNGNYQAISFTAAPNPVAFTHPTQGQTGVSTPATFTWSTTPAATGYQLWIGVSHHGDGSLLKSGWLRPGTSSYSVPALPAGQTLYARIYTGVASGWGNYQDITFTTAGPAVATANRAITKKLTTLAAQQPTPAWMQRLLRLEPNLH